MSDYQMSINGSLDQKDKKCVDKYLGMVNCDDSVLICLENFSESDQKTISELCRTNNIIIDKEEGSISGKYIIKGIKDTHCAD